MVIAVVLTAVFVRLGVWQLERLEARRGDGLAASERLARPAVDLNAWLATWRGSADESADLVWRRVQLTGRPDYRNEIVLRGRLRDGAPGVHVATPVLIETGASAADWGEAGAEAVLVIRGWLPAPDAMRANLRAVRPSAESPNEGAPPETVYLTGFVVPSVERHTIPPQVIDFEGESHTVLAALDLSDIREALPYAVAPVLVQRTDASETAAGAWSAEEMSGGWSVPAVLPPPAFDNGPHLAYAVQWFAFAVISLVGGIAFVRRSR